LIQSKEKIGQKEINLELSNGRLYPHKGVIETTESMIDRQTGNIAFRAKFHNPEGVLKHGLTGKVTLTHALENTMLVPQKSTFEIQGNLYVYCVDKNGTVKMRKIEASRRLDPYYAIHDGLSNSDFFVLDGVQKVKEGDQVDFQLPQYTEVKK
jgi:membrane fusion protein (multidrug efflux system)